MDRSSGSFTSFTTRNGLPDNTIEDILEDDQGYLWLATHNGLSRFHPQSGSVRNYSESDGLPGNSLGRGYRAQSGELMFGSTNGLTTFYPDRLTPNTYVPPVVLTGLNLFNKPVNPGSALAFAQADLGDGYTDADPQPEYLHTRVRRPELHGAREEPVSIPPGGTGSGMERCGQRAAPGHLHQPSRGKIRVSRPGIQQRRGMERSWRDPADYGAAAVVGHMVVQRHGRH